MKRAEALKLSIKLWKLLSKNPNEIKQILLVILTTIIYKKLLAAQRKDKIKSMKRKEKIK